MAWYSRPARWLRRTGARGSRLRRGRFALPLALSLLATGGAAGVPPPATAAPPGGALPGQTEAAAERAAPSTSDMEWTMLWYVNADRTANGVAPLALDVGAVEVARTRAATQLSRPTMSHYDDSGQFAVLPLFAAAGIGYQLVAENLVRLYAPESTAAELAEGALMNSPGHRANLLNPDFDLVAVGAAQDPAAGRIVFAQVFRRSP